mgnify:CR=1 FL=1
MFSRSALSTSTAIAMALALTACGGSADSSNDDAKGGGDWTPVTIKHALGTTTINEKSERVATVDFANQEVPLALGIVPVGMSKMTWGDDDGDGAGDAEGAQASGLPFTSAKQQPWK